MAEDLLTHYQRELTYIRRLAGEFADAHPKIAGRLRLSGEATDDPFVARLIEAFAYLNARVRTKLDDDFPELTDALIGVLYPHYLAPIPSMAIARFDCQADMTGPYHLPPGMEINTETVAGDTCLFRTAYPLTLWPIALDTVAFGARPMTAPPNPRAAGAAAILRVGLRCLGDAATFSSLGIDNLRFYLSGPAQQALPLYELIHNNCVSVALADGPTDPNPVILPPRAIKPVGFGPDEGLLSYPARSHLGYRLLTEYFAFPEKFLFFDLEGLEAKTLMDAGRRLEIFFYLNRGSADLERSIGQDSLALGCSPIVNLFPLRAEPIAVTQLASEYRVVPDSRRPVSTEVYSIESVEGSDTQGQATRFEPFYAMHHGGGQKAYWHATRRPGRRGEGGTEVFLSLVDEAFDPAARPGMTLSTEILCLNRDLPSRLPFGGGQPRLAPAEAPAALRGITCMTPPTPTLRPALGKHGRWRLVSHLALNHLSLTDDAGGLEALREILRLYDFRDAPETRAIIDSVLKVSSRRGSARMPGDALGGFARGVDVTIEFEGERFSAAGLYLFASVLERFLGLYCSVNSFSRLTATIRGRPQPLKRWPARAGETVLL
ncbi:type VI secretion system baseplate subunit TssF [Inquilinus limosus]|uniref:type VI secretion system baseplate subunit TssF n=1 Tax=Inquilinus limosus TaxID=171674 RepID=UPI000428FFB0|nr:type VI secretion system baseplate subunit TssF [Inquilinus limosus]